MKILSSFTLFAILLGFGQSAFSNCSSDSIKFERLRNSVFELTNEFTFSQLPQMEELNKILSEVNAINRIEQKPFEKNCFSKPIEDSIKALDLILDSDKYMEMSQNKTYANEKVLNKLWNLRNSLVRTLLTIYDAK